MSKRKQYAIYEFDKFVFMGTIKECAEHLSVNEKSARFYSTPTHKKRIDDGRNGTILVKVDD